MKRADQNHNRVFSLSFIALSPLFLLARSPSPSSLFCMHRVTARAAGFARRTTATERSSNSSTRLVRPSPKLTVIDRRSISTSTSRFAVSSSSESAMPPSPPFVSAAGFLDAAAVAKDMLKFIDASWTQFHAVAAAATRLEAAGFVRVSERETWEDISKSSKSAAIKPGGRYYFTRSGSTLVAFAVGGQAKPGAPFHMVGAHTDSPCLKVKPVSAGVKSGYAMVNVEPYGGGLWTTWFDRDLTVAGRVLVKKESGNGSSPNAPPRIEARLVAIDRPLLRVPMLAIHLQRELAEGGFKPNKQQHLVPMLATAVKKAVEGKKGSAKEEERKKGDEDDKTKTGAAPLSKKHHPALLDLIAVELSVSVEDIVDFDLNVCDTQRGTLGGAEEEFVFVGRLDNLAMSYCATTALIDAFGKESPGGEQRLNEETAVKAVALFDHEEVGSSSAQGAGGPVMRDAMFRVSRALAASFCFEAANSEEDRPMLSSLGDAAARSAQSSFLVSADMAHALHPNYSDRHEPDHKPLFGKGLVIKHNANQRYATDALSAALFREVGSRSEMLKKDSGSGIPSQEFCVRSDMACGSTIGPILSSGLGVRTVDVGAPQLSMHSIREMCAVKDVRLSFFSQFFFRFLGVLDLFRPRLSPQKIETIKNRSATRTPTSAPSSRTSPRWPRPSMRTRSTRRGRWGRWTTPRASSASRERVFVFFVFFFHFCN